MLACLYVDHMKVKQQEFDKWIIGFTKVINKDKFFSEWEMAPLWGWICHSRGGKNLMWICSKISPTHGNIFLMRICSNFYHKKNIFYREFVTIFFSQFVNIFFFSLKILNTKCIVFFQNLLHTQPIWNLVKLFTHTNHKAPLCVQQSECATA